MSITQHYGPPYIDKGRIVEALRKYGTGPAYSFRADGLDIVWQCYLAEGMGEWAEANGFTLNPYVAHDNFVGWIKTEGGLTLRVAAS